jgi:hypothetical protein
MKMSLPQSFTRCVFVYLAFVRVFIYLVEVFFHTVWYNCFCVVCTVAFAPSSTESTLMCPFTPFLRSRPSFFSFFNSTVLSALCVNNCKTGTALFSPWFVKLSSLSNLSGYGLSCQLLLDRLKGASWIPVSKAWSIISGSEMMEINAPQNPT